MKKKKKPAKVEEAQAPYHPRKGEAQGRRAMDGAAFKRVADKIFSERKDLLHKLAQ